MVKLCLGGIEIAQNVMLDLRVVDNELWVRHNGIPEGCELVAMHMSRKLRTWMVGEGEAIRQYVKKWRIIQGGSREIKDKQNFTYTKGKAMYWYVPELMKGENISSGTTIKCLGTMSGDEFSSATDCLVYYYDVDDDRVRISGSYSKCATTLRNVHLPFALAIVKYGGTGPHDRNQILAFKRFNVNIIYDRLNGCFKETLSVV